jgi:coiled-coil domain-containing protein 130
MRSDAFARLERTIEDREQLVRATARIDELESANDSTWDDPYEQNRRLRREFRVGRHAREEEGRIAEDLKERMGLGIDLLPAADEDAKRAALVDFGSVDERGETTGGEKALARPLFGSPTAKSRLRSTTEGSKKRLKSEIAASHMRDSLVSEIIGNTLASHDPFLVQGSNARVPARIPGIKRKRDELEAQSTSEPAQSQDTTASTALVSYGSDSE